MFVVERPRRVGRLGASGGRLPATRLSHIGRGVSQPGNGATRDGGGGLSFLQGSPDAAWRA